MKLAFAAPLLLTASLALASPTHEPADGAVAPDDAPRPVKAPARAGVKAHPAPAVSAEDALQRLIDGNDRFRHDESRFPRLDPSRRGQTFADGQQPIAAVLGCADSRVPVEAVFDQGIGDLFVIRVAGNVADVDEIGTIEYGVGHLNIPLVVVLGHTKCGAVTAVAEGAKLHGHLAKLVDNIAPAVADVKQRDPEAVGNRLVRLSIRANVLQSMHDLITGSAELTAAVRAGRVRVVGAVYDLQTGAVEWIGPHPREVELVRGGATTAAKPTLLTPHAATDVSPAHGTNEHPPAGKGDDHPTTDPAHHGPGAHAKPPPRSENWPALGGLLGASAVASGATIRFVYGRRSEPPAPTEPGKSSHG